MDARLPVDPLNQRGWGLGLDFLPPLGLDRGDFFEIVACTVMMVALYIALRSIGLERARRGRSTRR